MSSTSKVVVAVTWTTVVEPSRRLTVIESAVLAVTSPATSGSETRTVIAVKVSPLVVPWAFTLTPTLTSAFDPAALPS